MENTSSSCNACAHACAHACLMLLQDEALGGVAPLGEDDLAEEHEDDADNIILSGDEAA